MIKAYDGLAQSTAAEQARVATRRQLILAGVPRWHLRNELKQRRWQAIGQQVIVLHSGPLDAAALRWVAVLRVSPAAALDGVTALQSHGLTTLQDEAVHVSVPKGARPRAVRGVVVHETRRYRAEDVMLGGIPRMRPSVAAVHAALWAVTARQASYFLILVVQQGLCTAEQLAAEVGRVTRHRWRREMVRTVAELGAGVRSLGELDVSRAMRSRGLPEPARQVLRVRPSGRQYLDADFPEYEVSLEVDGDQHDSPAARLNDLVRDVDLAIEGRVVVRIPLTAWRLDQARVLDALERLFASRGWLRPAA